MELNNFLNVPLACDFVSAGERMSFAFAEYKRATIFTLHTDDKNHKEIRKRDNDVETKMGKKQPVTTGNSWRSKYTVRKSS